MRESAEVRALAVRLFEAASAGDYAALRAAVASERDVLFIGTDPDEWWSGQEAVIGALTTPPDVEVTGGVVAEHEVLAYEAGDVGWAAIRGKVVFPGQAPIPLRVTLVCQRERSAWGVVQWHGSIGVPNEEAIHEAVIIHAG